MEWFPSHVDRGQMAWKFDVLVLLAVIGSSAIVKHIPTITASRFSLLPRLIPAPDTFLNTDRITRMSAVTNVKLVGVRSGTTTHELNYFANLLLDIGSLDKYEFRVYTLEFNGNKDAEAGKIALKELKIKHLSWVNVTIWISVLILAGLFVMAGVIHDGVALLALTAMGLSSSAAGVSAWWTPKMTERDAKCNVPPADQVIMTRNGAMVVVKCDEEVCREMYVGMDVCEFVFGEVWHRILLGTSTLLLMVSIVLFNNCTWRMQVAIGAAFFVLNIQYWLLALLVKPRDVWDLSRYKLEETQMKQENKQGDKVKPSFTNTLWLAIRETKTAEWARWAQVAPVSEKWDKWLAQAKQHINDPDWDAVKAKDRLFEGNQNEKKTAQSMRQV